MDDSGSDTDLFNELAHEFAERYRRGEHPSPAEYEARHPDLAEEIRELFPALVMMERLGTEEDPTSGSDEGRRRPGPPMPERLGDYRLIRELGRGGMGIVYEAVQESLGRHVALKVLCLDRRLGRVQLLRFRREARVAALLHHTNIVPVFFVGEDDGVHYYAMQYIRGQGLHLVLADLARLRKAGARGSTSGSGVGSLSASLATRFLIDGPPTLGAGPGSYTIARPPETPPDASPDGGPASSLVEGRAPGRPPSNSSIFGGPEARYFRGVARMGVQVAEALAYAHLHGVVHRDIKPANLLLDLSGNIWVTDFGLARTEGGEGLTGPGDVIGTVRYMAPERFRGEAGPRGDVYSLGVTLYEMITLRPAFEAHHRPQLIHAILHQEPTRPRKHDRRIPRDLETIVLKAMAKDPAHRFEDAREMASELGRFVDGRPIQARRPSAPERLWRWSRRNPAVALLLLLAASLTTVLAIGSTAAAWKFREQRDAVISAQAGTTISLDRALKAERLGRAELGRSLLRQAKAIRFSGQAGRRLESLQTLADSARIAREDGAPLEHVAELRDEVIAALAIADEEPAGTWTRLDGMPIGATASAEADLYVRLADDGSIEVRRLSDRAEVRVLARDRPATRSRPTFVPGGRFLVVPSSTGTKLWDLREGKIPDAWPTDAQVVDSRADGGQVAVLRADGEVHVYDLPSLTESARCKVVLDPMIRFHTSHLSLSEDGRRLAFFQGDTKFARVYDLPDGRLAREVPMPTTRVYRSVALDRTGRLLAIAHDRVISVYDMADGEPLARLQGHQSEGLYARFQPGGSLLASSAWDGTVRLWDPVRGNLLVAIRGSAFQWDVAGDHLEVARWSDLVRYRIAPGSERRTIDCRLLGASAGATLYGPARLSYSPDGRLLAMTLRPDGVRIVRASDGEPLAHLPIGNCDEALFLPDGSLLTSNVRGLCRWPLRRLPGGGSRLGPPEPLAQTPRQPGYINRGLAADGAGRLVGAIVPTRPGALLVDPAHPRRRAWITPEDPLLDLAIAPDGRWAAASVLKDPSGPGLVKVWDVAGGRVVAEFPIGPARLAFGPDGRWLGIGSEGRYRFFEASTWRPGPQIEGGGERGSYPVAFHPGGRVAAIADAKGLKIRLVEIETGATLALLEAPDSSSASFLTFSPDGRSLAVAKSDQRVDLWDLAEVRRKLDRLDLASSLPNIFEGGETPDDGPPIDRIEVEGASPPGLGLLAIRQAVLELELIVRGMVDSAPVDAQELAIRGARWSRMGQWPLALADFRAALARSPDSATAANNLAWTLAVSPGRGDPEEAVRLARKALAIQPGSVDIRNTLGVALYRAGHLEEAAALLEANAPRNPNRGYDWAVLAMCRRRLGRPAEAGAALDKARRWRASTIWLTPDAIAEFDALMREVEAVAGGVLPDLPADVFAR